MSSSSPRQRIFQRDKKRVSIRLEEDFWVQLETCAKEGGLRLSDLIFDHIDRLDPSTNRSSLLRVYCVRWLRDRLLRARMGALAYDLNSLIAACPVPCILLTGDRRIARHNQAFVDQVINKLFPAHKSDNTKGLMKLSIGEPYVNIIKRLKEMEDNLVSTNIEFSSNKDIINMTGNFSVAQNHLERKEYLICFLH